MYCISNFWFSESCSISREDIVASDWYSWNLATGRHLTPRCFTKPLMCNQEQIHLKQQNLCLFLISSLILSIVWSLWLASAKSANISLQSWPADSLSSIAFIVSRSFSHIKTPTVQYVRMGSKHKSASSKTSDRKENTLVNLFTM